jgi:hypothetical protein
VKAGPGRSRLEEGLFGGVGDTRKCDANPAAAAYQQLRSSQVARRHHLSCHCLLLKKLSELSGLGASWTEIEGWSRTDVDVDWMASYVASLVVKVIQTPRGNMLSETPTKRRDRVRLEALILEQARAEIAAGQGIDDEALEAWLDELDHDANAPLPVPRTSSHP